MPRVCPGSPGEAVLLAWECRGLRLVGGFLKRGNSPRRVSRATVWWVIGAESSLGIYSNQTAAGCPVNKPPGPEGWKAVANLESYAQSDQE